MANARGKAIDNTHLSIDQAEARGFIHRDYIAHCLRWTHVAKYLQSRYRDSRVLDVGCGVDLPLARLCYSSRLIVEEFIALDYNASGKFAMGPFHTGKFPLSAYGRVDFASDRVKTRDAEWRDDAKHVLYVKGDNAECEHLLPNVITSFEMIEHVEPGHARATMRKIYHIMSMAKSVNGGSPVAFISTPCWSESVGAAGNHVNEMTYEALGAMLEDLGFQIENVAGTFASQRDYKPQLDADGYLPLFNRLAEHYDSNYLATIFAPLYPALSRNALWTLRVPSQPFERRFVPLEEVRGRWTSSERWEDLAKDDAYAAG